VSAQGQVRRWVVAVAAGLALAVGPASLASAHESRHQRGTATFEDQEVVELTTSGTRSASGLTYHQTHADSVTATNAAVAYAACDDCRAVSLSMQVVVADGGPSTLDVGNVAVAMTENCTGCEAVAVAYQLVIASGDRLKLSGAGHRELADLRRDLRRLARSDASPEEVQAQADALMAQVTATLSQELRVRVKVRCDRDHEERPAAHRGHGRDRNHGDAPHQAQEGKHRGH
jgi:hypothetical protein